MWELVPELDPLLPSFTDLLFLGSRGSTVSEIQPRNHTGTITLQFSGDAGSIVTIASEDHPPIITDKLTIRSILYHVCSSLVTIFRVQFVGANDRGHHRRCANGKDHRQWLDHFLRPRTAAKWRRLSHPFLLPPSFKNGTKFSSYLFSVETHTIYLHTLHILSPSVWV